MPDVTISIGGRNFDVACQEGEEPYLKSAAKMLDDEATTLSDQVGRMPEARMLLMAGLMLADKTASFEDQLKDANRKLAEKDAELDNLRTKAATPDRVEVPVVPQSMKDSLAELAARAEALAAKVEEQTG